jgi:hypothetical protein
VFRSFLFDFFLNLGRQMNDNGGDVAQAFPDAFAQAWPQGDSPVEIVGAGWSPGVMQDFSGSGA